MLESLEHEYFNWLSAKVVDRKARMYHDLLRILYTTEFIWIVHNDENRAGDGKELRYDFYRETHAKRNVLFEQQPCSMLEMFYSFAKRASFQTDTPTRTWFWMIMENLHLDQFRQVSSADLVMIQDILDTLIWRTYDSHGYGGMFPMTHVDRDQREIEIWWQFCDYVKELGLV